ncbi:farnesyl cysteine-carboxyl methyltransferase [Emydomyces testavorans]|uniref:Protein-S-isoprenylcysteine O-methyltransferase n=1 Tax=Emydomyces testavorans TaxID=2070801 RepID=A0AAF0IIE8_9EURO|nr:farnesyl cysteine-carboxyl methyltransferase [Emydomyces testavorans]
MESTTFATSLENTSSRSSTSFDSRPNYRPYRPGANGVNMPNVLQIVEPPYLPGGEKSLSGISIRSFLLGQAAGICVGLTLLLYTSASPLWRVPFFIASLALFHFLEYYITARYNTFFATITAFLLTQNGAAYNIAHGSAIAECLLAHLFLPNEYFAWTAAIFGGIKYQVLLGLLMMTVGQIVRSWAMMQAGVSFTHTVQRHRREEHRLVKDGIYSIFRHPSYFGFFWWGLGTQLVLGNTVCFLGYAAVLWEFFASRIRSEEKLLIDFFGKEYVEYRSKTWVGIPGIS